jgi:methyl-accepting chemotaxis protein
MLNLANWKIGKRLAVGFGVPGMLALALAVLAWWGTSSLSQATKDAFLEAEKMNAVHEVASDVDGVLLKVFDIVLSKDVQSRQANLAQLQQLREAYGKHNDWLDANVKTEEGKRSLAQFREAIAVARQLDNTAMALSQQGKSAEAIDLLVREGTPARDNVHKSNDSILTWRDKRMEEAKNDADTTLSHIRWMLILCLVASICVAGFLGFAIANSITRPLATGVSLLERISQGDVTSDVPEELRTRKDEIGDLSVAMQTMTESLRSLVREVSSGISTVAVSATELSAVSKQTVSGVAGMSEKAHTVAVAAEESSANTDSVAISMEESAASIASVSTAAEEMSATIGDIASNTAQARMISEQARAQAETITVEMHKLGQAAEEIGQVTETITNISAQTNLLALNATIEAARAGTAGKGFAVVAHEIKELARQTAEATEDIKARIAGVQNSATSAVQDIEKITTITKHVGEIVVGIAAAIEQQATATRDIAGNINQAANGVMDSNQRISQTAQVSREIARDIAMVNTSLTEVRDGGEQVQISAHELSKLAEQLKAQVARFRA